MNIQMSTYFVCGENDFIDYLGNATGISQRTASYFSRFQTVTDNEVIYWRSN